MSPPGVAYIAYKEPLKNVSTWRGIIKSGTVTFFTERERVRIGYICNPGRGL